MVVRFVVLDFACGSSGCVLWLRVVVVVVCCGCVLWLRVVVVCCGCELWTCRCGCVLCLRL